MLYRIYELQFKQIENFNLAYCYYRGYDFKVIVFNFVVAHLYACF